jgi:ketosteroid isomerase-like protein
MSTPRFASSRDAEKAFYDAFERASLEDMMNVWADDDAIVCIHPAGPRLLGRRAVEESWRQILEGGARLRFDIGDARTTIEGGIAVHCVHENIRHGTGFSERSLVLATNIYVSTQRGWRMMVHHASPAPVQQPAREVPPASRLH